MTYSWPKNNRVVDRKMLDKSHDARCVACNRRGCDPAHIKTRGSGGHDVWWNVMDLCRTHHQFQGQHGWKRIADKFEAVMLDLTAKGWYFNERDQIKRDVQEVPTEGNSGDTPSSPKNSSDFDK